MYRPPSLREQLGLPGGGGSSRPPTLMETLQRQRESLPSGTVPMPGGGPPKPTGYDPGREQMFAEMLRSGSQPSGPMVSNWEGLGKLAQIISGSFGSNRQQNARQEEMRRAQASEQETAGARTADLDRLAQAFGASPDMAGIASRQPDMMGAVLGSIPQPEAPPEPMEPPEAMWSPEGQVAFPNDIEEARAMAAEGYQLEPPEGAEADDGFTAGGIPFGPDGQPLVDPSELGRMREQARLWTRPQQRGPLVSVNTGDGSTGPAPLPELNEGERKTMIATNVFTDALGELQTEGEDGNPIYHSLTSKSDAIAGKVPFGLGAPLQAESYRRAENSLGRIENAMLRLESGGAINAGETARIKELYWPVWGETEGEIADKLGNLQTYLDGISSSLPPEWQDYIGQPEPGEEPVPTAGAFEQGLERAAAAGGEAAGDVRQDLMSYMDPATSPFRGRGGNMAAGGQPPGTPDPFDGSPGNPDIQPEPYLGGPGSVDEQNDAARLRGGAVGGTAAFFLARRFGLPVRAVAAAMGAYSGAELMQRLQWMAGMPHPDDEADMPFPPQSRQPGRGGRGGVGTVADMSDDDLMAALGL